MLDSIIKEFETEFWELLSFGLRFKIARWWRFNYLREGEVKQ